MACKKFYEKYVFHIYAVSKPLIRNTGTYVQSDPCCLIALAWKSYLAKEILIFNFNRTAVPTGAMVYKIHIKNLLFDQGCGNNKTFCLSIDKFADKINLSEQICTCPEIRHT